MSVFVEGQPPLFVCLCGERRDYPIVGGKTPPIGVEIFCLGCSRTWRLREVSEDSWSWHERPDAERMTGPRLQAVDFGTQAGVSPRVLATISANDTVEIDAVTRRATARAAFHLAAKATSAIEATLTTDPALAVSALVVAAKMAAHRAGMTDDALVEILLYRDGRRPSGASA